MNQRVTRSLMQPRIKLAVLVVVTMVLSLLAGCAATGNTGSSIDSRRAEASRLNTELGAGYMRRGSYELALQKLEKALQYDDKNVVALSTLGLLHEQLGDANEAEKYHEKAIKAKPDDASAHNNYGTFLCNTGQYRASEEHFLKAASNVFYQTPEVALTNAGRCVARIPDWAAAEQHLRDAIQFLPDYPIALYSLSEIKYQQQDFLSARAFLQRYEAGAPQSAASLLLGYRIEQSLSRPEQAAEYARQLQQQFPNTAQATEVDNDEPAT